jgi:predicted secreted hydrolase
VTSRQRFLCGPAILAFLAAAAAGATILWLRGERRPEVSPAARVSVAAAFGDDDAAGFARADGPRAFSFPRDHGPHHEFRTEWWYYTGNLHARDGRHFGFQLTFFRHALRPSLLARTSRWGATEMYLAHFAVTDTRRGRFVAFERSSRGAFGLAGASSEPFRVWLDDWSVEGDERAALPMRLRAAEGDNAIDLTLASAKPVVLEGEAGLSRKGPVPGTASYYYSMTRMPARGTVRLGDDRLTVEGLAWMDREWSTSALDGNLAGWDWFALQLDDGRDVMFYRLRDKVGQAAPWSAGVLVAAGGDARPLVKDEVRIEALATWRSPRTGVTYPARWRLTMPARGLTLDLVPRLDDQELHVSPRYWEGAVVVQGRDGGGPVTGHGYVELVGYGDPAPR